jgi:DNA-binding transcriptional ArsR family regulator
MSHHLRTLREAGLVADRREGRWIYYGLSEAALASVKLVLYGLQAG